MKTTVSLDPTLQFVSNHFFKKVKIIIGDKSVLGAYVFYVQLVWSVINKGSLLIFVFPQENCFYSSYYFIRAKRF